MINYFGAPITCDGRSMIRGSGYAMCDQCACECSVHTKIINGMELMDGNELKDGGSQLCKTLY